MRNHQKPVGFLLFRLFPLYCLILAIEVLRLANRYGANPSFQWRLLSANGEAVEASNALSIAVDRAVSPSIALSHALIFSGDAPTTDESKACQKALRAWDRAGTVLGGVDGGAFALAKAGLLGGHAAAVHPSGIGAFRERFPDAKVSPRTVSQSPGRLTSAGGLAVIPMMRRIVAAAAGEALAQRVMEDMVVDSLAGHTGGLDISHEHAGKPLAKTLELMSQALEEPLSLEALAQEVSVSPRHLVRLFQNHLETTPMAHYRLIRLRHAQQLLYQTSLSVTEISLACGFTSLASFSRAYKDNFGRSPQSARKTLKQEGHRGLVPSGWRGRPLNINPVVPTE